MTTPPQKSTVTTHLICPLIAPTIQQMRHEMAQALAQGADAGECRLDHLSDLPSAEQLAALLQGHAARTIITLRPVRQGGRYIGSEERRLAVLADAAKLGPLAIDVEMDVPPDKWPAAQIILSYHDFAAVPANLDELAAQLDRSPAAINKIAFAAAGPEDALRALDILRSCTKPTIALAMGEAGLPSRLLARKFGAFGTFAALSSQTQSAPGQPTLAEFIGLYRWNNVEPTTGLYGVIGCPVGHSMSPAIHNAAFAQAGVDGLYVPLLIQSGAENFNRFMNALAARPWLGWRGLSVTIPHKENALAYVGPDRCDGLSRTIGAINTITFGDGGTAGQNTDYAAAIDALCMAMGISRAQLSRRCVAVLGAGGAARSIVAALRHYGAAVTVYNRTVERAQELAAEFGAAAGSLSQAAECSAEIVINCTPLGMAPHAAASPLERIPSAAKVVFDTIYNPIQTLLLRQAEQAGCRTVSGLEMFVNQAAAQFEAWTHRPAPRDVMRRVVVERLAKP